MRAAMGRLASAGLSALQRRCLAGIVFDGLSHGGVARRLGRTVGSVKQHVHRARRKLAAAGMAARRLKRTEPPVVVTMDPARMDELQPWEVKGRW